MQDREAGIMSPYSGSWCSSATASIMREYEPELRRVLSFCELMDMEYRMNERITWEAPRKLRIMPPAQSKPRYMRTFRGRLFKIGRRG